MERTSEKIMKKVFICGKGGSGKTTITCLIARVLAGEMKTMVVDGDGSNPRGISAMLGIEKLPPPLIGFFGGTEKVGCPVDVPGPLTRIGDDTPIIEHPLTLKEISKYIVRAGNIVFARSGKITGLGGGCTGPMGKVIRDLAIKGEGVVLVDSEAGTEFFGRRIPENADGVILIIDPTFESVTIAQYVNQFCQEMNIKKLWFILNKIRTTENIVRRELGKIEDKVVGVLHCHPELETAGLGRTRVEQCEGAFQEIKKIAKKIKRELN